MVRHMSLSETRICKDFKEKNMSIEIYYGFIHHGDHTVYIWTVFEKVTFTCVITLHEKTYLLVSIVTTWIFRVSFRRGGGGGTFTPSCYSFAPPWNLFANKHTTITLYVTPSKSFKFTFRPPLNEFSKWNPVTCNPLIKTTLET